MGWATSLVSPPDGDLTAFMASQRRLKTQDWSVFYPGHGAEVLAPNARVEAILDAGHRTFGENKVQEAAGKWPDFRERYDGIDLHLIGPLQSNKARQNQLRSQSVVFWDT